jgi:hypothetical protein
MKFITSYSIFFNEQASTDPNINVKTKTAINYDKMVKEYNTKKNEISALFENPNINDDEIKNQLKRYTDPKGIFKNDLLRMWWDLCNYSYQVKVKERKINNVNKDIDKQENRLGTSDTEIKPKIQQIVTNMETISDNYTDDIKILKEKILKLGKDIEEKLSEFTDSSKNIKRELNQNKT